MQPENQQINPQPVSSVQPIIGGQPPQEFVPVQLPPQNPIVPADKKKSLMPKLVKILLIVFVVIGALFFINLFAPKAIQIIKENNPLASPTPEPTPTATPVVNYPPSKYASDPEVLQIEARLQTLEDGLNAIEFSDDTLHPPLLDWEISFEK